MSWDWRKSDGTEGIAGEAALQYAQKGNTLVLLAAQWSAYHWVYKQT